MFRAITAALLALAWLASPAQATTRDPQVSFTVSPQSPEAGQTVTLDASASTCWSGGRRAASNCVSYRWTVDGSPIGSGRVLATSFQDAGDRNVSLTVTDKAGRMNLRSIIVGVVVVAGAGGAGITITGGGGGGPSSTMYVRAGATGTGDGSDWTNACTDFTGSCAPANLQRGYTYYVAAGNYAYRNWDAMPAASGTSAITIKGATGSDHGTATGWSSSYGVGTSGNQAHWASAVDAGGGNHNVNWRLDGLQYVTFDGNTACNTATGSWCSDPSTYGFVFDQPASCTIDNDDAYMQTGTVSHVTFAHIAATICGSDATSDVGRVAFSDDFAQAKMSNITYSHIYCRHIEVCMDFRRNIGSGGDGSAASNITVEYLYAVDATSTSSHHGEIVNPVDLATNLILRWSYLDGCAGTDCISANNSGTGNNTAATVDGASIYGNVFANSTAGNGAIGGQDSGGSGWANTAIYNNTFYNDSTGPLGANAHGQTGNTFQDNIVYGMDATVSNATEDYNTFGSTTSTPSETHGQTGISNPFVTLSTTTGASNFHLTFDTSAWNSTGQPSGNGTDPDGVTRTSSRGAYQF